jgi:hypothetical protein
MPKGKKKAGGAAPGAGDVDFIEDEDPTDMPSAAAAPAKPGMAKFTTSPTLDDGSWRPSGELRKKKGGKGWKKRWCHLVRARDAMRTPGKTPSRVFVCTLLTRSRRCTPIDRRARSFGTVPTRDILSTADGGQSGLK